MRRHVEGLLLLFVAGLVAFGAAGRVAAQVAVEDVEVIIAIDTSESMESAIDEATAAATSFIASMPEGVRIGIETFADEVTVLAPPTDDRAALVALLDGIETGGDTALYDVVARAPGLFTPEVEHKVLVVLSDGKDEGSTASLDDATAAAAWIRVESISLTTNQTDLGALSAFGPVTSADDASGVATAFDRVASLLVETIEPAPSTAATTTTAPPTVPTTTVPATTAESTAAPTTVAPAVVVPADDGTDGPSRAWLWLGAGALFAGLFLLGLLLFPRAQVSRVRLGVTKPRSASDLGVRTVSAVEAALERHGRRAALGNTLAVADIGMKPAEFVTMVLIVAVVASLVTLFLVGPIVAVLVGALVCGGVWAYVAHAKAKRQAAFADQLPDVLQLVSSALRSGFGLTQSLESVAEDAEEPARSEFAQVLAEVRLGRDLSESMYALAHRMESKDLEWIVGAIDINREAGGNLAEVLEQVGVTIRERGRIARHVRTLTAEGRLSARILALLPFALVLWQWRVNPDNFELLTSGAGLVALFIAGILVVLGWLWVSRLVRSVTL